ncbi:unnamed protein product, partial [Amoebophrya sp. A25]|eukprot:GSA25T00019538001.1
MSDGESTAAREGEEKKVDDAESATSKDVARDATNTDKKAPAASEGSTLQDAEARTTKTDIGQTNPTRQSLETSAAVIHSILANAVDKADLTRDQ